MERYTSDLILLDSPFDNREDDDDITGAFFETEQMDAKETIEIPSRSEDIAAMQNSQVRNTRGSVHRASDPNFKPKRSYA